MATDCALPNASCQYYPLVISLRPILLVIRVRVIDCNLDIANQGHSPLVKWYDFAQMIANAIVGTAGENQCGKAAQR